MVEEGGEGGEADGGKTRAESQWKVVLKGEFWGTLQARWDEEWGDRGV